MNYRDLAERMGLPVPEDVQWHLDNAPESGVVEEPDYVGRVVFAESVGVVGFCDDEGVELDEDCDCDDDDDNDDDCEHTLSVGYVYPGIPLTSPCYTVWLGAMRLATKAEVWRWFLSLRKNTNPQ